MLTTPDLRLQLLEPDKYPHLYKCLYGLLMLLPQSSAFAALRNRLNSVSSIGYLHIAPRPYVPTNTASSHARHGSVVETIHFLPTSPRSSSKTGPSGILETHTFAPYSSATTPSATSFDRPNRLKGREEGIIRWVDLLEKFRSVQERARRAQRLGGNLDDGPTLGVGDLRITDSLDMPAAKPMGRAPPVPQKDAPAPAAPAAKKSGLGRQFGRLGGAMPGRGKRAQQQNQ